MNIKYPVYQCNFEVATLKTKTLHHASLYRIHNTKENANFPANPISYTYSSIFSSVSTYTHFMNIYFTVQLTL